MNIAVCDDESLFRAELIELLQSYEKLKGQTFVYYEYSDGHDILSSEASFDLIFMDYQMKSINGIDTVAVLRRRNDNTAVVFVSSYKDVVFDSLKVNTHRFLIKPVDTDKLFEALDSFIRNYNNLNFVLLSYEPDDSTEKVPESSIIYAEADDKYCKIRTYDKIYICKKTLSQFEKDLRSDFFFRSHRSYIVNFKYIKSYTKNSISFENNEKAELTKTKYIGFQKAYFSFLKRNDMGLAT